jgi:hypothetical protein
MLRRIGGPLIGLDEDAVYWVGCGCGCDLIEHVDSQTNV